VSVRDAEGRDIDLVRSPLQIAGAHLPNANAPPTLGQHTSEVLQSLLGLSAEKIGKLREHGVL